jgi:hypothetical protein
MDVSLCREIDEALLGQELRNLQFYKSYYQEAAIEFAESLDNIIISLLFPSAS